MLNKIKYIVIGPSGTGKTTIINKYINPDFNFKKTDITIGCDFYMKEFKLDDETNYKLHIWDTAGNLKYNNMENLINNIDKIIIVLDFNKDNKTSLKFYLDVALKYCNIDDIIIVYNKTPKDSLFFYNTILHTELTTPKMTTDELIKKINNLNIVYCNAEYNINIDKIFEILIYNNHDPYEKIIDTKSKCSIL